MVSRRALPGEPMKISLILAHPDSTSYNHSIAATVASQLKSNGHEVIFRDLYAEKFDPLLHTEEVPKDAALPAEIEQHCREIAAADGIVIVHPNWWGQPPAILKGWIDRVLRPGIAYEFQEGQSGVGEPLGLLKAEAVVVFNTSNTATEREQRVFGDPLERLWKDCIFGLCGVTRFYRRLFNVMVLSTSSQRAAWLEEVRSLVDEVFPASSQESTGE